MRGNPHSFLSCLVLGLICGKLIKQLICGDEINSYIIYVERELKCIFVKTLPGALIDLSTKDYARLSPEHQVFGAFSLPNPMTSPRVIVDAVSQNIKACQVYNSPDLGDNLFGQS